jgi:starch phosphorylase
MATLAETWRSHRMVQQYVDNFYLPGAVRSGLLLDHEAQRARQLAASLTRVEAAWPGVGVTVRDTDRLADGHVAVTIDVECGGLGVDDLVVELWIEVEDSADYPLEADVLEVGAGVATYRATVPHAVADRAVFAARVLPRIHDAPSRFLPGLITWSP